MWIKILLIILALLGGVAVSGGSFALIIKLGVFTRLAEFTHTGKHIKLIESFITLGGICGTIITCFDISVPLGKIGLLISGIFFGIFVGWMYMALAETLSVFPIVFRRLKLKYGVGCAVLFMGLGKMIGSLLYFLNSFG